MTAPTILSPWYVVQRFRSVAMLGQLEFYRMSDEGSYWSENEKDALLFMSLQSAVRIADAEGAHVRVLASEAHLKEFRP